jgi:hypothetical protein
VTMSWDQPLFTHRRNDDRTIDSICMKCFRTVDTQSREPILAAKEKDTSAKVVTSCRALRSTQIRGPESSPT